MNTLKGLFLCAALLIASSDLMADRVKDLASIAGVRENQLLGYGLVVGLDGTGDSSSAFTEQSMRSMLSQYGVTIPEGTKISSKNVAAVSIHATLPPFTKPGQTIDITASSLANAKSLRGGSLLMTPLRGADGEVYAIAQGDLIVGGLGVSGADGSSITINIPSVGRIPNGASVERNVPTSFATTADVILNLHSPDFTTAKRLEQAINTKLGSNQAQALDAVSIKVKAPRSVSQKVAFVSFLETIDVDPGEAAAKIIINSRTGTIVIGNHVSVMPAAVTHGSLTVTIDEGVAISQPGAFSQGETVAAPVSNVTVEQEDNRMFKLEKGVTLNDIVQAVNQVGAAPGDLVAILEALKQAGALRAQLIVI